jgi:two-component system chemotaxis response regulator CheY
VFHVLADGPALEALGQAVSTFCVQPEIKLVISDVNMPNMDGLTMVEKIRGELANTSVNVIMLTTESSPAMKERGKAAGVKGWIVKPFKGEAVLETFRKLAS